MPRAFDEAMLTAYVLGELSAPEREAVELYLEESEQARREVESIRETADLLRRALVRDAPDRLTARQRTAIEERLSAPRPFRAHPRWWGAAATATAVLATAALLGWWVERGHWVPGAAPVPSPRVVESRVTDEPPAPPAAEPARPNGPIGDAPREVKGLPQAGGDSKATATVSTGTVQGQAVDVTGAAVPGATVKIVGETSGVRRQVQTQVSGAFLFPAVPPGRYTLAVELTGFQTAERRHLEVARARVADVGPVTLDVAALTETVSVAADSPVRQSSSLSAAIEVPEHIDELRALGYLGTGLQDETGDQEVRRASAPFTTESYDAVRHNPFVAVTQQPLSTFSVDVDTASYANVRRFLTAGELPPPGAVRIEELVNAFDYGYEAPRGEHPVSVHLDVASCPWASSHDLVRVGLKGREIEAHGRPPTNLVFLIDVSGSMEPPEKLPLLKHALRLMIEKLDERDRVAVVVYAGASGLVLPPTSGSDHERLLGALERLSAGGTTHGSAGIRLAYQTATEGFIQGGVNRVILATDGDFNVGLTSEDELTRLIESQAKSGVFLTVLGFGMGNYKDSTLEKLADHGNGYYAYVDTLHEAKRVLVDELAGTLVTIAKDVKIQVEFNPARVAEYRLIGYENRLLADEDFDDDTKDAGEIGAGHAVTALYEVVPSEARPLARRSRSLRYQEPRPLSERASDGDLLTIQVRYKLPDGERSVVLEEELQDGAVPFDEAPEGLRFASAVAAMGMILRDSPYKGTATLSEVARWARDAVGEDVNRERAEFLDLVARARRLTDQGGTR